jgi:hypothetical protein
VKTKSGLVPKILVTNLSFVAIVISDRWVVSAAPQVVQNVPGYLGSRISGRHPHGLRRDGRSLRSRTAIAQLRLPGDYRIDARDGAQVFVNSLKLAIRHVVECRPTHDLQ